MTTCESDYRRGCRCSACRESHRDRIRGQRVRRFDRLHRLTPEQDDTHGTTSGYDAGCRCEACRLSRQMRYWASGGPRRHEWRDYVTTIYRDTRDARDALRESGGIVPSSLVTGASGAQIAWYQLDASEFDRIVPAVTFRQVLEQNK